METGQVHYGHRWVYTLYNPSGNGEVAFLRYTPRTVIDPKVKSTLHWRNGKFEYHYRIRNGKTAKQEIAEMEVRAHAATWINLELITSEKLAVLNPKLDQLIAALEQQNKPAIHAAAVAVLQETFMRQKGLHYGKIDSDDDNQDPQAINLEQVNSMVTMKVKPVDNQPLNRVAARALAFDVMYLLTRAYIGK